MENRNFTSSLDHHAIINLISSVSVSSSACQTCNVVESSSGFSCISESARVTLEQELKLSTDDLMVLLLQIVKVKARPPISDFFVGAVGLAESGRLYFGCNLEFVGVPISNTVHAEQFLIANLMHHKETSLLSLAVTAPPCGHCRQFMYELPNPNKIRICILTSILNENISYRLTNLEFLLPMGFGPSSLGMLVPLLSPWNNNLKMDGIHASDSLITLAFKAANQSYAPYSGCPSGIALEFNEGKIVIGIYIESAAYNPSLPPLQSALIAATMAGLYFTTIKRVVLVEKQHSSCGNLSIDTITNVSHSVATEFLLSLIAPSAEFHRIKVTDNSVCDVDDQRSHHLLSIFSTIDSNGDGFISLSELEHTAADNYKFVAHSLMECFDINHDGKISLTEWMSVLRHAPTSLDYIPLLRTSLGLDDPHIK